MKIPPSTAAAILLAALALLLSGRAPAQEEEHHGLEQGAEPPTSAIQVPDEAYGEQIRASTTAPCFSTPLVDHLPASDTVPTPLKVLGHIAGAPDVLSYSHEVHRYLRAVAESSPRVALFSAGTSEEGREMILVVVASEESIANLEHHKAMTRKLADPRGMSPQKARELIATTKPIYWATGGLHSPETGSPEMLMELVYRLAVEETPFVRAIRENLIFMTTPVLEVDGRDKRVDLLKLSQAKPKVAVPRLLYWGKYVAHDNNRDGLILSLALSKMLQRVFMEYHPQVLHDLHESASHLYISTGTGPYNAWIDPILVDEWHLLAYQEVDEMTKMGVPGVWTHGFYDGWAPNYGFYVANGHNAIGRFYETQGAGSANTRRIRTRSSRAWYRPNPPLSSTMWSIRNNVNLQQSALLIGLNNVATHRQKFMENFYLKGQRSIAKARNEGPAAYVFPADDPRPGQAAALLGVLRLQGCEIHRITREAHIGKLTIPAGSRVVRMDQPYSRMADMLLDRAYYNAEDPRPYDDTGWTLGPLFNTTVIRVEDPAILDVYMEEVAGELQPSGRIIPLTRGAPRAYLVNANADPRLATFRFAHPRLEIAAAEQPFEMGGVSFAAGTFVIAAPVEASGVAGELAAAAARRGFDAYATSELPAVPTHAVGVPRVALVHTWTRTQNEGWVRIALDAFEIPYEYISVHELRDDPDLRAKYDVLLMGPSSSDALRVVRGLPKTGEPIAWKASELAPNIGRQDQTEDMRGGLELEGVIHLRDFIRAGGTFIAIQNSVSLPVHFGLAPGVSIATTEDLRASGCVLNAQLSDRLSPIGYGYGEKLGVYFRNAPVLRARGGSPRWRRSSSGSSEERLLGGLARPTGRGTPEDPDRPQGRARNLGSTKEKETSEDQTKAKSDAKGSKPTLPERGAVRTVVRFAPRYQDLLISGLLVGGDELAGTPALLDVPLGEGHVVLFAINPMWRHETQGSYALVFNAILHSGHLDAGTRAKEKKEKPGADRGPAIAGGRN